MRRDSERIEAVHHKAAEIRRQTERRILTGLAACSACLLAMIVGITASLNGLHQSLQDGGFTGSSLLDSGAGGYVLVGVLSFAAAVIITVICIRYRRR